MQKRRLLGSVIALLVLIPATNASAEVPFTANAVQAGGGLRYGLYMGDDEGDPPNPYGLGLGIAAGYTLDFGLYLGGEFNYFFGSSEDIGSVKVSQNIMQYGVEVGYDIGLSPEFVLRPKAGIGMGSISAEMGDLSADESGIFIPIGAQALYSMGGWFLSGEARYALFGITTDTTNLVTGEDEEIDTNLAGLILGVGAGATF